MMQPANHQPRKNLPSTSAFSLHSRTVPLKPLILSIARDRAQWSNYFSHNDRYSNAINVNPVCSAELQINSRDFVIHSCFWFPTCLVTTVLLGYTKKHHCLRNDNKLTFMKSLGSLPFTIFFLHFLFFLFAGFCIYQDWIFSLLCNFLLLWSGHFPVCSFFLCAARS